MFYFVLFLIIFPRRKVNFLVIKNSSPMQISRKEISRPILSSYSTQGIILRLNWFYFLTNLQRARVSQLGHFNSTLQLHCSNFRLSGNITTELCRERVFQGIRVFRTVFSVNSQPIKPLSLTKSLQLMEISR